MNENAQKKDIFIITILMGKNAVHLGQFDEMSVRMQNTFFCCMFYLISSEKRVEINIQLNYHHIYVIKSLFPYSTHTVSFASFASNEKTSNKLNIISTVNRIPSHKDEYNAFIWKNPSNNSLLQSVYFHTKHNNVEHS